MVLHRLREAAGLSRMAMKIERRSGFGPVVRRTDRPRAFARDGRTAEGRSSAQNPSKPGEQPGGRQRARARQGSRDMQRPSGHPARGRYLSRQVSWLAGHSRLSWPSRRGSAPVTRIGQAAHRVQLRGQLRRRTGFPLSRRPHGRRNLDPGRKHPGGENVKHDIKISLYHA